MPDQTYLDRAAKSGRRVTQEVADAIENGELPLRYQRNAQTLRPQDQTSLARARVLLVGCGGLGGYVLEFLARAGVGTILACDPDRVELHNTNRQLLATSGTLGRFKVQAACERAAAANPLISVEPFPEGVHAGLFRGVGIAIDCLGGATHRKGLQTMAAAANVPLVSASVSGWTALLSTTWPGETGLGELMNGRENGSELSQGIPSPVVGFAASLQAAEVIRILAGASSALRSKLLVADLAKMRFSTVSLEKRILR
ncbi:MAG: thiamine biosynthesis protein ThiF [Desulfovibrionales bacterium]|nr:thiamine biosynthesis protein ThiF [Desulfovibrionales bacterium]